MTTTAPEAPPTQVEDVATADLCRSAPFALVREEGDAGDGRTFRGYAAVFNQTTVIDSWEGRFEEQVAPGAFKKTLSERTPVMMFNHGKPGLWDTYPIGTYTDVREDEHGVYTEGRLLGNWLVEPIREAVAAGAVDGMSFRFSVVRDRWEMDGKRLSSREDILSAISRSDGPMPTRTLLEVKAPEMGPVTHAAYSGTTAGLRSVTVNLDGQIGDDDRRNLARALFAAEAARTQELPGDSPEGTSEEAADHEARDNEPPQVTVEADEHGSETTEEPTGPSTSDMRKWREKNSLPTLRYMSTGE